MSTRPPSLRKPAPVETTSNVSTGGAWAEILGLSKPDKVVIDDNSVRGLAALNRAKGLVVASVATMLVNASVTGPQGLSVDVPRVIRRPHPLLGAFEFYEQVVDLAVMHGNYVAIRVGYGEDEQLVPVPLGMVNMQVESGLPWYRIGERVYNWTEVFHVRVGAPIGSWWGVGVVEQYRKALSEQLHSQAYGEASFRSGSVPSMTVQIDDPSPTEQQVDATKIGLMAKFGMGQREPLVHGSGMVVTPVSWSPHDAQFVEARQISYAEAALMVGLRPEDIGASLGTSMTYGNRSDDALQRITDGYAPWMARIEGPLSDLLGEGYEVRGNPEALLRTSTRERLEIRGLAQAIGVETKEESRTEEGRSPMTVVTPTEDAPTEEVA